MSARRLLAATDRQSVMSWRLIILTIVIAWCSTTACERQPTVPGTAVASPTTKPAEEGPQLKAAMTDPEILRAFGLDPSSVKREVVQGKDGTSTTYVAGDQNITVTRSLVSGVTVMASGRVSGVWPLGQP
jgi:hypothetical protein